MVFRLFIPSDLFVSREIWVLKDNECSVTKNVQKNETQVSMHPQVHAEHVCIGTLHLLKLALDFGPLCGKTLEIRYRAVISRFQFKTDLWTQYRSYLVRPATV